MVKSFKIKRHTIIAGFGIPKGPWFGLRRSEGVGGKVMVAWIGPACLATVTH